MNRLLFVARVFKRFLHSRGFSMCFLSAVLSLTLYAITSTRNVVFLQDNGGAAVICTAQRELEDILKESSISVTGDDEVYFSGFDGNVAQIKISRAFPVEISADRTTKRVMMIEGTVSDALKKANVSIDADDLINRPLYELLDKSVEVVINRIDYRTMSYEEEIPYSVEERPTPLIGVGRSRLLQAGENGTKILTYGETTKDGVVQEAELLGENIVKAPTTQIYLVGANVPVSPYDFGYTISGNAPTVYKDAILNVTATGYSATYGVKGASGNSLSAGHVAVDPNIIPYNSKLYITSPDGSFVYGYAIASDTGYGLGNGALWIDLFYETYEESLLNGVRTVNVYILE